MRKRRPFLLLIGVAALVLLVLLAVGAFRSREPEYERKKLSEWVESYADASKPAPGEKDEAIRRIGTNAIPYLLEWIAYQPRKWELKMLLTQNPRIKRLNQTWDIAGRRRHVRAVCAPRAFMALGPQAQMAIPGLRQIMLDPERPESAARAVDALANLGNAGLAPLIDGLARHEPKAFVPWFVIRIGQMGSEAKAAVPALTAMLQDFDPSLRSLATNSLRQIDPGALRRAR